MKFLEIIDRSKKTEAPTPHSPKETSNNQTRSETTDSKKKIQKIDLDPNEFWQKLIQNFAPNNFSLLTLLKSCKLDSFGEGIAKVFVYYAFHKEQLEQNKNRELLNQAVKELIGTDVQFDFVLQETSNLADPQISEPDLILAAKDSLL